MVRQSLRNIPIDYVAHTAHITNQDVGEERKPRSLPQCSSASLLDCGPDSHPAEENLDTTSVVFLQGTTHHPNGNASGMRQKC